MGVFAGPSRPIRVVKDGTSFSAECASCAKQSTFREVLVRRSVRLLGLDLYDYDETGVRCDACSTAFTEEDALELLERAGPASPEERVAREARTMARYKAEFEAQARKRQAKDAEVRKHEEAKRAREAEVDAELAALKRRLGK